MLDNIPNIHLIDLYDKHYLYDVNTNAIASITPKVYEYLKEILKSKTAHNEIIDRLYEDLDLRSKKGLEYLINARMLKPLNDKLEIKHFETDILKDLYENNLRSLTLQVTQNCNLRCKYCVYSGSYNNRVHNNKRMSWETAKKAIDFFHKRNITMDEAVFGFYGGEPLLEFELLKKCAEYIEEKFEGKKIYYTITTNATLLDEEKIRFLVKHNFNVVVSLDGPEDVQNKNRIFADEHRGTFKTIMENLKKIKDIDEEFYKKVSFNAVIDLNSNFTCANDFFVSYDMVKDLDVSANFVNNTNRKEETMVNTEYYLQSQYELFKIFLYYCTEDFFTTYRPSLLNSVISSLKTSMKERLKIAGDSLVKASPGGQCLPGVQRFFVTAYGEFYPCERVNEKSDVLNIGNINDGFNVEKAADILNICELTKEECKKCWCFKMCTQCVNFSEEDGKFSRSRRLSECGKTRLYAENQMKDYIVLKNFKCNFDKEVDRNG